MAGYKVYRDGTEVGTSTTTSYSDTGLTASTQYCYTVSAYDVAGNESEQGAQVCTTTSAGQVELLTEDVTMKSQVMDDAGISVEGYTATTFLSEVTMSDAQDTTITFAKADRGQILFVEDTDGNPTIVAYVTKDEINNRTFSLTLDSIADGLIMSNPLMIGYPPEDRLSILSHAKSDSLYTDLKNEINNALNEEPENLLNEAVYPKVYEYSITLILNAISTLTTNQTLKLAKESPDVVVGDDDAPYLSDVAGDDIIFVNPTMVFYGIDIGGFSPQLIMGKEQAWGLLWWQHGPVTEEFSLGDGVFDIRFTKGAFFGTGADKMAATANTLKAIQLVLDTIFWCPISNETIEKIVEGDTLEGLAGIVIEYGEEAPEEILGKVIELLLEKENWVKITKAFYKNADDKEAVVKFLTNSKKVLKAAYAIFKAIEVYDAATKTVPFFWDVAFKPAEVNLCATQTDGILEATCVKIPPTAKIVKVSPDIPYVGDTVTFDASNSYDDTDTPETLQVKWDFDGNGTFDTDWTTQKTASYIYSNVGSYDVWLEVKDSDGLVGNTLVRQAKLGASYRVPRKRAGSPETGKA